MLAESDPMWQALIGLLGASPPAVATIICVIIFLRHIKDENKETRDLHNEHREQFKTVVANCNDVIKDNTAALRENAAALARIKPNV